jgi:hypothetical protein
MDPVLGIGLIIAAVAALVLVKAKMQKPDTSLADAARERAAQRAIDRQYLDTVPQGGDHWANRLDMKSLTVEEVDDSFDGRGKLTDSQKRIINAIMDGVDVSYVDAPIDRAWDVTCNENRVESVDPWANTVR